ncbi:MAG TPA: HPF/RaiA family ribosome-associated protein [Bdellovibrionales bacterium]|jgi:ribosome-associated translation inhibitor RaiA|nr:HPF/RaiA family ribosome-associated protein [Bdellovibrionales bacterium]
MRIEVRFRHMERSEALETFALDKVGQAVEEFGHRHDSHVLVWLVSELNLVNRGTGEFICEIEVRVPRRKQYFVSRASTDMHTSIVEAVDRLKTVLDEAGKKEISQRNEAGRFTPPSLT